MKVKSNPHYYHRSSLNELNCCALLCFSYAFKVDYDIVKQIFKLTGRKHSDGSTFTQCKKVGETLAVMKNKFITYHNNKNGMSLKTFTKTMKGRFIINHSEHLSFFQNGTIVDEYLYAHHYQYNTDKKFRLKLKILGWWEITNRNTNIF